MVTRSYNNVINPVGVSLSIERLLIADYPTSHTFGDTKVDLGSLPTGFYDLGAVVEDTPSIKATREKYSIETGLPRVLQFETVQAVNGTFEATLHSNSWRKVQYAFGNFTATCSATAATTVASVNDDGLTFLVAGDPSIVAGQQIVITAGSVDAADALEVRVGSATSSLIYTVKSTPYGTITTGDTLYTYTHVEQVIGARAIKYYSLIGVADFLDGSQVCHEMRKVSPAGDWEESFRPDESGRIPLMFNALAWSATIGSCTELVIAKRHYYPSVDATCQA